MQTARLENWWMIFYGPKDVVTLGGTVFGHPLLTDGHQVQTSQLKEINVPENYAVTLNTRYTLGPVSPAFLNLYESMDEPVSDLTTLHQVFEPELVA